MLYQIGIYKPNSLEAVLQTFETSFPLITNSYDNFVEIISYIKVNEIIYKVIKTTIYANEKSYEQVLHPKSGFVGDELLLKGTLAQGDLIPIELVTQSGKTPKQIKVPILPRTNNDYIKNEKRYYQCWELIQSKENIQVVVGDSYAEDK